MPIQFELCQDPQMLEQYYQLRERCFRQELKLPDFDGSEEERDRESLILIARIGDQCVGGARVAPSNPITGQLNELSLAADECCMWERFVIDPVVRTVQLVRDFCVQLIEVSRASGYASAVVLSSLRNARFYRQCHTALGVGFEICGQMPSAACDALKDLEHYLSVSKISEATPARIAVPVRKAA